MASSGAHSIAIDECMALDSVGAIAQQQHIGFIGNLHVSAVLFEETEETASDVERCMQEGQRYSGYVFGLGGPITQHIALSRMEAAVKAYRQRR
jgi:uroporphyrinogen-III decarboxylase